MPIILLADRSTRESNVVVVMMPIATVLNTSSPAAAVVSCANELAVEVRLPLPFFISSKQVFGSETKGVDSKSIVLRHELRVVDSESVVFATKFLVSTRDSCFSIATASEVLFSTLVA